jgi:hypothetical protein
VAEADPELDPEQKAEQESQPTPAQVGGSSHWLFSRPGADSRLRVYLPWEWEPSVNDPLPPTPLQDPGK